MGMGCTTTEVGKDKQKYTIVWFVCYTWGGINHLKSAMICKRHILETLKQPLDN